MKGIDRYTPTVYGVGYLGIGKYKEHKPKGLKTNVVQFYTKNPDKYYYGYKFKKLSNEKTFIF